MIHYNMILKVLIYLGKMPILHSFYLFYVLFSQSITNIARHVSEDENKTNLVCHVY
jgi:hypothetical protein